MQRTLHRVHPAVCLLLYPCLPIRRREAARIPSLSEQKINLRPCRNTAAFGMISAFH